MHHLPSFARCGSLRCRRQRLVGCTSTCLTPTVARGACSHPFSHRGLTATEPTRRLARARPQRPPPPARPRQPAAGGRCPRRRPPGATPRRPSHTPHGVTHHGPTGMASVQTWPLGPRREEPSSADQRSPRQTPGTSGSRRCARSRPRALRSGRVECRQLRRAPLVRIESRRTARSGSRSRCRRSRSPRTCIPPCRTHRRRSAPRRHGRKSSGGTTRPPRSHRPSVQSGHAPQSCGQVLHVSHPLHTPSPHRAHIPF